MSEVLLYFIGSVFRLLLIQTGLFGLSERSEFASPINSFKRLKEGVVLSQNGQDPYAGVLFHETPIILHVFKFLFENCNDLWINLIFIGCDILTAWLLGQAANLVTKWLINNQTQRLKDYHDDAKRELLLKEEDMTSVSSNVQIAYLLHPYLIGSCAARTTSVFSNMFFAFFLLTCMKRKLTWACLFLAVCAYQSVYPIMLVVPLVLICQEASQPMITTALRASLTTLAFLSLLCYASYLLMNGSWTYIQSTWGFILSVPELTPNMGLFWYFFTEMFEHFRVFFVCTFQINCFVFVIPLGAKLQHQPFLLIISLMAITAVFKSYPTYGDVGLYMSLLPTMSYLSPYMKQSFLVANSFIATTILGPVLYQLWIYNGSANANFFFAITLVFGTAQIFLITDLLFAYVKREFFLKKGLEWQRSGNEEPKPLLLLQ